MRKLRALICVALCLAMLFAVNAIPAVGHAAETGEEIFRVGDAVYSDFAKAMSASASGGVPAVLTRDATLPAGEYLIPSGATLLIPRDEEASGSISSPDAVDEFPQETTAFRTLTLSSGAAITVRGVLALAGAVTVANDDSGKSVATGAYGAVEAQAGSSVTVGYGGSLYAWGQITGEGEIIANKGSKVCERLGVYGYPGLLKLFRMAIGFPDIFPFDCFAVESIEAPLTVNSGAAAMGCTYMKLFSQSPVMVSYTVVGEKGLMNLGIGATFTKVIDPETHRAALKLNGNITADAASLVYSGGSFNLSRSVIPFPYTDIVIESGKFSSSLRFIVSSGSTLTIARGAEMVVDGALYTAGRSSVLDVNGLLTVNGEIGTFDVYLTSSARTGSLYLNSDKEPVIRVLEENDGELSAYDLRLDQPVLLNSDDSYADTADHPEGAGYSMIDGVWTKLITVDLVKSSGEHIGYAYAAKGEIPKLPTPETYYDDYYRYVFLGWRDLFVPAEEPASYTAVYRKILRADENAKSRLRGDADGNGEVDILDATHIQRWLVGLDGDDNAVMEALGDADGDGSTSILDATTIQRFLAGFTNIHDVDRPMYWYAPTECFVVAPTEKPTQPQTEDPAQPTVQRPTAEPGPTEPYELPVF